MNTGKAGFVSHNGPKISYYIICKNYAKNVWLPFCDFYPSFSRRTSEVLLLNLSLVSQLKYLYGKPMTVLITKQQ